MGGWGRFWFDAQLIAISERKVVDGKNETITTPRLSFRFLNVGPGAERELNMHWWCRTLTEPARCSEPSHPIAKRR